MARINNMLRSYVNSVFAIFTNENLKDTKKNLEFIGI
jgi:hypothetical protein